MSTSSPHPRHTVDCREVRTKAAAFAVFRHRGSPQVISAALLVTLVARLLVGDWSWWDLGGVGLVFALTPFTEWMIHLFILHSEPVSIGGVKLDTGAGHRAHHLDPGRVEFILLRAVDAALFLPMIAILVGAITAPVMWVLGAPVLAPTFTAVLIAIAKLLEYEWAHFFFHTAYRPRTPWYRRLKRNHRLHHWRNERYWLGVTVNLGDRLLGTYPRSKTDVMLSPTARTLGSDTEP